MLADVELFAHFKVFEKCVNAIGNAIDVGVVLICPFLSAPMHHDAKELGVREGESLAHHQDVLI